MQWYSTESWNRKWNKNQGIKQSKCVIFLETIFQTGYWIYHLSAYNLHERHSNRIVNIFLDNCFFILKLFIYLNLALSLIFCCTSQKCLLLQYYWNRIKRWIVIFSLAVLRTICNFVLFPTILLVLSLITKPYNYTTDFWCFIISN